MTAGGPCRSVMEEIEKHLKKEPVNANIIANTSKGKGRKSGGERKRNLRGKTWKKPGRNEKDHAKSVRR